MTRLDTRGREPPGVAISHERLSQYRRYAALVSSQEAALDEGDLDQVREISDEISNLQARIGSLPLGESGVLQGEQDLEVAAGVLRDALDKTRQVASRLRAMRQSEGTEIRRVLARHPQARAYVAKDAESEPPTRLDVQS